MPADFVYENPPLVEVIVEVRWLLQPLGVVAGGAVDPHFSAVTEDLTRKLVGMGFSHVEKLVPDMVPLELLAHRPSHRYRKAPETWPLYQLGPGLFTVNIVPPYQGWASFREVVRQGLERLYETYPLAERYLRAERVELRYIDGFTARHGMKSHAQFVQDYLTLSSKLPDALLDRSLELSGEVSAISEFTFPVKGMVQTRGVIKATPGTVKGEQAAILEFIVRRESPPEFISIDNLVTWFDKAHEEVKEWFTLVTTAELRATFGPTKEV